MLSGRQDVEGRDCCRVPCGPCGCCDYRSFDLARSRFANLRARKPGLPRTPSHDFLSEQPQPIRNPPRKARRNRQLALPPRPAVQPVLLRRLAHIPTVARSATGELPGRPIRWHGRGRPPGYTPTAQTSNVVLRPPGHRSRCAVDSAPAFAAVGRRFAPSRRDTRAAARRGAGPRLEGCCGKGHHPLCHVTRRIHFQAG